MTTVTITDIGSDEVIIPVSDTSDIIVQTLSDGPPLGNYIADHSLAINLESDDHPQYLNITRGDARYSSKTHEEDTTIHFTLDDVVVEASNIIGLDQPNILYKSHIGSPNNLDSLVQPYSEVLYLSTASFTSELKLKLDSINTDNLLYSDNIGSSIQAYSSILQDTTASFTTLLETKLNNIDDTNLLYNTDIGTVVQEYSLVLANTTASFTTELETTLNNFADNGFLNSSDIGTIVQGYSLILDNTTESFTTALKNKLDGINDVNLLYASNIGNTIQGYSLVLDNTEESFTTVLKNKLDGIEALAEVNNISDTNATALTNSLNTSLHYHDSDRNRANHTGTQALSTITNTNIIGSPTGNVLLSNIISTLESAGFTSTVSVSHSGSGLLNIGSCEYFIRDTTDGTGTLYSGTKASDSTVVVPNNTLSYVYLDHNSGSPIWASTTNPLDINVSSKIPVAIIYRKDETLNILNVSRDSTDCNAKFRKKSFYTEGLKRGSGLILTNPDTNRISISSGKYWFGLSEYSHNQLVAGNPFTYYYKGVDWISVPGTEINCSQYNNFGIGLTSLPSNSYSNQWVYLITGIHTTAYAVVYGQQSYTYLSSALAELEPTELPDLISNLGLLVGIVTTYQATASIVKIRDVEHLDPNGKYRGDAFSSEVPHELDVTSLTTLQDAYRLFNTSTIVSGGNLVDNADGTFYIEACEVVLRVSNSEVAELRVYSLPQTSNFSPNINDVTYYYINYNAGSPQWESSLSRSSSNGLDKISGYVVSNKNNRLFTIDTRSQSIDGNRKLRRMLLETSGNNFNGFWHTLDGTILTTSDLNLLVSMGKFYYGINSIECLPINTSNPGTDDLTSFDYYTNRSSWTFTDGHKEVNNTQYDGGILGLTTLSNNKFRSDWVYLLLGNQTSKLIVIMGNTEYASLIEAQEDAIPTSVPGFLEGAGVLLGQIIVEANATTVFVRSIFEKSLGGTSTVGTFHNTLSGLQGGTTNEYYHLTSAEKTLFDTLHTSNPPATSTSPGIAGTITWDASNIYVCVATDTWVKSPLTTW